MQQYKGTLVEMLASGQQVVGQGEDDGDSRTIAVVVCITEGEVVRVVVDDAGGNNG